MKNLQPYVIYPFKTAVQEFRTALRDFDHTEDCLSTFLYVFFQAAADPATEKESVEVEIEHLLEAFDDEPVGFSVSLRSQLDNALRCLGVGLFSAMEQINANDRLPMEFFPYDYHSLTKNNDLVLRHYEYDKAAPVPCLAGL